MAEPGDTEFPNIRHMQVLCQTIHLGSVSRAADLLNLTQPAASQGIAKLENELGADLTQRSPGKITATPAGLAFAARADRAVELLRDGAAVARRAAGIGSRASAQHFVRNITAAQLRTLIAVGDAGSFTVAARELGLAQPTIHRSARAFEAVCEFEVFRNTPVGIDLTPAGQLLLQHTKLARAELRQGREEIAAITGVGRMRFVLGSLPLARTQIVPRAITAMIEDSPDVQVRVVEGRYQELLRGLREGDLDCLIGALRSPAPADDVAEERLFDDHLAIICGERHPLARQPVVTLEDTLAYPWIAPPKSTPAGSYLFEALRIEERPKTPVRVVSSSLMLIRSLLTQGDFVTIISRHQVAQELASGAFVALPISLKNDRRAIGLTYRHKWRPTVAQARFVEHLREAAKLATQTRP